MILTADRGDRLWASVVALAAAWGVLSIGGVYKWGYVPLGLTSAAAGCVALARWRERISLSVTVALAACLAIVALQLVPLPATWWRAMNPARWAVIDPALSFYGVHLGMLGSTAAAHSISVDPGATARALGLGSAFALLAAGATGMTHAAASRLRTGLILLGVAISLEAIVQRGTGTQLVYGLWKPGEGTEPFGPFVNKNHFAGCVLMILPLALMQFSGRVIGVHDRGAGFRRLLEWLSSAAGASTSLLGFGSLVMILALALTQSRSGMIGFAVIILGLGWALSRRTSRRGARSAALTSLSLIAVIAVLWAGADVALERFARSDVSTLGNRMGVWRDTWSLFERSPYLGAGVDVFARVHPAIQTFDLEHSYRAAHNDYLQLLAEGGIVLGVVVLLTLAALVKRFRQPSPVQVAWIHAGACLSLLAIGAQELVDFSLQMPGNAVVCSALIGLAGFRGLRS